MKQAGTATYLVNGLGQRVRKNTGSDSYFAYDEAGHLIGEYDSSGAAIEETVWLGDLPVAIIKPSGGSFNVFYVWTDNLGSPRQVSDTSNVVRWTWDNNDPFGNNASNENPAGAGTFNYNLRFPGQYADAESGLSSNSMRDFDSMMGRYIEPDPVAVSGLAFLGNNVPSLDQFALSWFGRRPTGALPSDGSEVGREEEHIVAPATQAPFGFVGLSLFSYVDGNPLRFLDALGLTKADKWFGYGDNAAFRDWWHREKKFYGIDEIPNKEVCDNLYKDFQDEQARGEKSGKGRKSGKGGQNKGETPLKRALKAIRGGRGGNGGE